jgi:hypothetical protein
LRISYDNRDAHFTEVVVAGDDRGDLDGSIPDEFEKKSSDRSGQLGRAATNALGGLIPGFSALLSAAAGVWSEEEQRQLNGLLTAWMRMIEQEMREKVQVMGEITARLDFHDEELKKRIQSDEYQHLLRKAFRNWSGTESRKKQEMVRNLLANAAATKLTSDIVIELFLDWLQKYSELHFAVIADIYANPGATRGEIWHRVGNGPVREDSAEADLFKLLVRDLSTGSIIRQHRETDYAGNFVARRAPRPVPRSQGTKVMKSAFDDAESYELTALGSQFVHYALSEITTKIEFKPEADGEPASEKAA